MIIDENTPRNQWPLGRVTETHKSKDGLVRSASIRMATKELDKKGRRSKDPSILKRPVQKLIVLV